MATLPRSVCCRQHKQSARSGRKQPVRSLRILRRRIRAQLLAIKPVFLRTAQENSHILL
jgi:hypothetical protein